MIRYPLYAITADVIGGMVGGVIGAVVFKACGTIPIAAIWGWFLTGTTTSGFEMFGIPSIGVQITGHVVGVILGSLTTAAIFISFLLIKDIRENKQNRIVNVNKQEEISKEEITNSIEAIDRVNKYLENVKVEYGDSNLKAHDEEKLKSLDGMVINFSKLKSTVGNETKIVPKLNYIIMRSGQKINILNDQLQKLTDNKEKEVSIKDKINGLEETIKQNEILLKESKQKISKEINSIIMYLDGYKKELNKYGK